MCAICLEHGKQRAQSGRLPFSPAGWLSCPTSSVRFCQKKDEGADKMIRWLTNCKTCEPQPPRCIYQPVQGVMDLMDARQSSQVGIQLKIWFRDGQERERFKD